MRDVPSFALPAPGRPRPHDPVARWAPWLLGLAAVLPAQDAPVGWAAVPGTYLARVHTDVGADGSVAVLAPGYKANLRADAIEYVPYFGGRAARTWPLTFHLATVRCGDRVLASPAAVSPRLDGQRVVYDRGAVREVWHLRAGEVEQTFELDAAWLARGAGDVVVHLDVETELDRQDTVDGLRFVHDALGFVLYGDVVVVDESGRRAAAPARLTATGIELRVPQAALRGMQGRVTIDPIVRAVSVDAGADIVGDADVAHEPTTGNWLVAYAREFATTDTDVVTRRFDRDGNLLEEVVVATGSRESRNPAVAANGTARQFLIVWDEDQAIANRVILGRLRDANSTAQSATFEVLDTSGIGNDDVGPRAGGSIATDATGSVYGVVCTSDTSAGPVLSFVRVTTSGSASRITTLSATAQQVVDARITRSRRNGEPWMCIYRVANGSTTSLHAAVAPASGAAISRGLVDGGNCELGGVAGRGSEFLAVYALSVGAGNSNVFARSLRPQTSSITMGTRVDLTALEPGGLAAADQRQPVVAFDGHRYTCVYQEAAGAAGSFDLFAAVVTLPGFAFSAGHQRVHSTTTDSELFPAIASTGEMGGEVARSFVVFDRLTSGDRDVAGALFDGTSADGGVTSVRTSCGGHRAVAENEPALGATLRLRASRTLPAGAVWIVGLPLPPLRLCSLGCALGVSPILLTAPGDALDLPLPGGIEVLGAQFAAQNVLLGTTGGCAPPSTPLPIVTSDTLVVRLR